MKCDIIIPIWNQLEFTTSCIEHTIKNTCYPYRLVLIDNGSDQETKNYLENLKDTKKAEIRLIRNDENLGFVKAVNQGLRISYAPYACVLNNDTEPGIGWLAELIEFAEMHPEAGLLNPLCNGHIKEGLTVDEYAKKVSLSNKGKFMEMNQCQGFCMLIKRELIEKIGYLDEKFGIGGFDDTDYSMRAHRAGYKSICVYSSYVYHKEHKSFDKMGDRKKIQSEAEKEYFKKWPRHKRVLMIFSVSKETSDKEIENVLNSALFMARQWRWLNLLIFGDRYIKGRIKTIKDRMNFPLHQNIKYNYLKKNLEIPEITIRMLERSFGSKRRKSYDVVICNEKNLEPLLRPLARLQGARILPFPRNDIPKCDIILPICDQYEFTKKCIESIRKNTDTPYRLIIINNGKNLKTKILLDELEKDTDVETAIVHNDHNIGWVKALNEGIELSRAPYICFQNDDTVVTRGWLRKMINILQLQEDFGMINPTWESKPANLSVDKFNDILEKNKRKFVKTDWCRGFSVVIKRSVIEKIGKVDEIYGLAYFDDVDYSVQATEAGFLCLRSLDTYVYHKRNVTFFEILKGKQWNELHEKNKLIYYKRWGKPLKIVIIIDKKSCQNKNTLDEIEDTIFYLARKQHHIDIWSPYQLPEDRFQHTNVKLKVCYSFLLRLILNLDLYLNKKKRPEKRYDAVFSTDTEDFDSVVRKTVDRMKEKTKELVNVEVRYHNSSLESARGYQRLY